MTFGGARMQAVFTISHATIDYAAFNRTNFNTAIDHLTRLLIIRGKNPLYGIYKDLLKQAKLLNYETTKNKINIVILYKSLHMIN